MQCGAKKQKRDDMPNTLLSSIEWHDLPVSAIRIEEAGLSLVVTPYNALADAYDTASSGSRMRNMSSSA